MIDHDGIEPVTDDVHRKGWDRPVLRKAWNRPELRKLETAGAEAAQQKADDELQGKGQGS